MKNILQEKTPKTWSELVTYLESNVKLIEASFKEGKSAGHQRLERCEKLCKEYWTSKIIAIEEKNPKLNHKQNCYKNRHVNLIGTWYTFLE